MLFDRIPVSLLVVSLLVCVLAQGAVLQEGEGGDPKLAGHARMLRVLAQLGEQSYRQDPNSGVDRLEALRAQRAAIDDGTPKYQLLNLYPALGLQELIQGNNEEAVELLEKSRQLALELPEEERPRGFMHLTYNLAVAWMRLGESQNCVARHTSQSCILPIEERGQHTDQTGSRKACGYLLEVLAATESESDTHLGARWLLNLAHMTLGDWPAAVPERDRIAPSTFASEAEFPRFHDVAGELGVSGSATSGGIAIEDYDGDGLLDLFVTTRDPLGQARLFRQRSEGGFEERTVAAGLTGIVGGLNLTHADYDSDGDVDVLLLRGGWQLGHHGQHPLSLLENQGPKEPGCFLDVTFLAGLGEVFHPTQTADWADYDLDGDLDLYVGNEATANGPFPSQLFRNQEGKFVDVAAAAGLQNMRMAKGVSWGDVDGDRDPDLYVSNYLDPNRLYLNRGDGTFTDVAVARGVEKPIDSFPCWFWDFDNDGALDLYVATYYQSTGEARLGPVVASYLGLPVRQDLNKLYKGDGRGHFRDVAKEQGLDLFTVIMGASFGDLDNDGFPDLYLGTGYPFYDGLVPNVMYWNRGGQRFADVTTAGGFGHLQKGHGISFADLDEDGDQDVYANMGGAYPGDAFGNVLFENPGCAQESQAHHWLKLRLQGGRSNRSGIGARVRAEFRERGQTRCVYQTVGQHGSFGNSPFELHLGLGSATRVERLEVFWPVSGETQVFTGLSADQRMRIVEGRAEAVSMPVRATPFRR